MDKGERISIREYARRRGCSDTAVRKAIAAGKIVRGIVDQDKPRPKILPEIADKEWEQHHNPNYERTTGKKTEPAVPAPVKKETKPNPQLKEEPDQETPDDPANPRRSLAKVKLLREEVKLQTDAISLKKMRGELVDRSKVYNALYEMGQELREGLNQIPDRVTDEMLAAKDRNAAHLILTKAILEILEEFSNKAEENPQI